MKTVADFTAEAVRKYLQSAVFIDDEIFARSSGKPVAGEVTLRPRKATIVAEEENAVEEPSPDGGAPAESSGDEPGPAEVKPGPEVKPAFHPKDIVASFAQKGVVCALYEPAVDFKIDETSEVFKLCQAADLVILDWDFHKDDGAKMRQLVANLVAQSNRIIPHHSRLVVIYTTTPDLAKVSDPLFDELKKFEITPEPVGSRLRLDVGATRVVVFGKAGVSRAAHFAEFSVEEKDLADAVFKEFVHKNQGILSAFALLAMAAVKKNSRRVLAKFSSEMDGAFLLHRGLVLHSEDSVENIPSLIAEEFLAVVEDQFAKIGDLSSVIGDSVQSMTFRSPAKPWTNGTGVAVTEKEFSAMMKALLTEGVKGLTPYEKWNEIKKLVKDKESFARPVPGAIMDAISNAVHDGQSKTGEKLAALFNSRTYYDKQVRFLTIGTVVRCEKGGNWDYLLCLMPLCETVRLIKGESRNFLFLRLAQALIGDGDGFVVEDSDQKLVRLLASSKTRKLMFEKFTPKGDVGVIVAEPEKKSFWFVADSQQRYEWVGQLKPAHAQRVAHGIGQTLSRVGLSEAEWVRLLCDKE